MSKINSYTVVKRIGEGNFGSVYLVKDKYNYEYALKKINAFKLKNRKDVEAMILEILIQKQHNSKFLIKYKDVFFYKDRINIVSEYAYNGDLNNYILKQQKNISNKLISKWILQISWGIYYLHNNNIIHRDIKPHNILLDYNYNIKIADFGISKIIRRCNKSYTVVGTPYYMCPELIENKVYNKKVDVWALGCILYYLLARKMPFTANNMPSLIYKIIKNRIKYDFTNIYKTEYIYLLNRMLTKNHKQRCNISYICSNSFLLKKSPFKLPQIEYHKNNFYKKYIIDLSYIKDIPLIVKKLKTNDIIDRLSPIIFDTVENFKRHSPIMFNTIKKFPNIPKLKPIKPCKKKVRLIKKNKNNLKLDLKGNKLLPRLPENHKHNIKIYKNNYVSPYRYNKKHKDKRCFR